MSEEGGFSIDQLMELAGLSVSQAGKYTFPCVCPYGRSHSPILYLLREQSIILSVNMLLIS